MLLWCHIFSLSSNRSIVKDAHDFFENVRRLSNTNVDFTEFVSVVIMMIGHNLVALNFIRHWDSMDDDDPDLERFEQSIRDKSQPEPAIELLIEIF